MMEWRRLAHAVFIYYTAKKVRIHSPLLGATARIIQLVVITYVIGYVIIYNKGYQEYSDIESTVTTKVKGILYTNHTDQNFRAEISDPSIYRRMWDAADFVIPPSETNAAFIVTNLIMTTNQTHGFCPENLRIKGAICDPKNNTCAVDEHLRRGNGITTGRCVLFKMGIYTCEVRAWCPLEVNVLPLKKKIGLLYGTKDFTILVKNFVSFPKFPNSNRRNIKDDVDENYLKNCRYDPKIDTSCPIFRLGDIVQFARHNYEDVSYKGGVISFIITWNCNFDKTSKDCFPTYSFRRLDSSLTEVSPGLNFRKAVYFSDKGRILYKYYGIKLIFLVEGKGGRFSIVPLFQAFGAGIALLALEIFICDIIALYISDKRALYYAKKFEDVDIDIESDDDPLIEEEPKFQQDLQLLNANDPTTLLSSESRPSKGL